MYSVMWWILSVSSECVTAMTREQPPNRHGRPSGRERVGYCPGVDVLLATCSAWPEGEPGAAALDAALTARGVGSRWVCWDDGGVDWAAADLVAVRSTWDYIHRPDELLTWARHVETTTALLNGADVFGWNVDKAYLTTLGEVPVVPTVPLDGRSGVREAVAAIGGPAVVKPRIGASGHGVVVADGPDDPRLDDVRDVPVVVQPLVASIRTEGEHSVFVLDGRAHSRIRKVPPADDIRAHEIRGATVTAVPLDDDVAALAERGAAVAGELVGKSIDYARLDLLLLDGAWCVGELEAIEPGLYLDVLPSTAGPFADLVVARLKDLGGDG
jgi:hypothetical protein